MSETTTFGAQVIDFFRSLKAPDKLPDEVVTLNPYANAPVMKAVTAFYTRYFHDSNRRVFLIGINPGRFGGGATGIAFTDSDAMRAWGIPNTIPETRELSAQFVSRVIEEYGGPERFYSHCFITSFCPLGFTKQGRNYNYYDDAGLRDAALPWIRQTFTRQVAFGAQRTAIVMGKGENYRMLSRMNRSCGFFDEIVPLEHPRFIMQYRRRSLEAFCRRYIDALAAAEAKCRSGR